MCVGAVMADLSRAFDSMPHQLLICKLRAYGLSLEACTMIASYLHERHQRVKLGPHKSPWQTLKKGFPQGSGHGPLLYNILSNDLFYFISVCHLFNYADDNTFTCCDPSYETVLTHLEMDTKSAINWFERNFMKVNPEKFQVIFLHPQGTIDNFPNTITLNDSQIARHSVTKLLGVSIDDNLTFHKHVNDICLKAYKQINALIRIRRYITVNDRFKIYNSFILSNLNFCPLVWHTCGSVSTKKLEKIQKRALRFVFNEFTSDYDTLLTKANVNTLFLSRLKYIATKVYKCVNSINNE